MTRKELLNPFDSDDDDGDSPYADLIQQTSAITNQKSPPELVSDASSEDLLNTPNTHLTTGLFTKPSPPATVGVADAATSSQTNELVSTHSSNASGIMSEEYDYCLELSSQQKGNY